MEFLVVLVIFLFCVLIGYLYLKAKFKVNLDGDEVAKTILERNDLNEKLDNDETTVPDPTLVEGTSKPEPVAEALPKKEKTKKKRYYNNKKSK